MTEKLCRVHFLPDDVSVNVDRGTTILDAARKAKVYVNSICGGDGICGKCKVIVREGQVESTPTTLLSRDEVRQDYVLACLTRVKSDLEVLVPEETRLEAGRILLDEDAERFGALAGPGGAVVMFRHDPLVRKVYLDLDAPTMEDPRADHDRLYESIRSTLDVGELQTGFRVLQGLPAVLQESGYKATATLGRRGCVTEVVQMEPGDRSRNCLGLAVDVGTTTIVVHLVDLVTSKTIGAEAKYNSQMRFGEDYIARIMYARDHKAYDELQRIVVGDINELINALVREHGVSLQDIVAVMCSGNTAMIHFLIGLDPSRIQTSPYVPSANFIPPLRAAQVGIRVNGRGLLYTLPSVAAYVGSDITAGATAIRFDLLDDLSLFVDIGTNGEVVLGNKEWAVCCSASAGPAFEGHGVKHGMRAALSAIEKVHIARDGSVEVETIGARQRPRGICGSGLLDCLAEMFRAGIVDRKGTLVGDAANGRVREGPDGLEFLVVERERAGIDSDIVITQPDISNLIRSKAAIYAAVSVLVESLELKIEDIQHIYLAGGFGNYLNIRSAITIGMLPDVDPSRVRFVGNASVAGAKMALLSREAHATTERLASQMTYQDMMQNNRFMEEFVSACFLPHTDIEEFPSVLKEMPV